MNYLKTTFVLILIILLFPSCKDEINNTNIIDPNISITDEELYSLAYANYQFPSDFYYEDSLIGSLYYENTNSITPLNERDGTWFQLCTNNVDTARYWSELSSNNSSYYRDLVSQRQTEKYFEFKRVYSINPNDIILSRVHKCTYIDRSMYDLLNPGQIIGVFKKNSFIKNDVKELIEYLWFTENYNNTSSKVYKELIQNSGLFYIYYLYEIGIVYGDYGMKDILSYIKHTFKINKGSGEITHHKELVKQIPGRQN
jgi:hypothetical protein